MHTLEVSFNITSGNLGFLILLVNFLLLVAGRAYNLAHFGAGTGPIFLDDVQCASSVSQLLECSSRPILSHNCQHSADAGVGCEGKWIGVQVQHVHATNNIFLLSLHNITQLHVQLVSYDWWVVTFQMKAEWRSV